MNWKITRQKMEGRDSMSATDGYGGESFDYAETFTARVRSILAHRRARWSETKQAARARFAREMKVSIRVVERWERGEFKSPRVDCWFAIEKKYEAICGWLEASARRHNSDSMEGTHAARDKCDLGVSSLDR